ncbi:class I SAM-dependent methyltransferase [Longimicrobium terrae]|uniref:Ubiquinone/menaquinone biosynthesis C-methylase UbiE n=1 Tax=Longimicrobium terrae TaxID=1639882 RepID=A0A841H3G1_9BACT|nr:class I SAM-dependent methyltransferase [Longimicrobium terrae]MBB4638141.1 ubiquinone/menaquinone biosynthesis C-methylase UbiE [Longimicrobium terrae]MBB6072513.1 ubiquinone/menaquinone biosynthesis C-methylase UbiE [Longimicrobium terrae]NNC32077.1 class I SAM-dependent methyltransferase [Longimicrobium terrae]
MTRSHDANTQSQFGPRAALYVTSAMHAAGPDLDALDEIAAEMRPERALDLGCGGGHVAYRLAPHAGEVMACDLSAEMLAVVAQTASERGLMNIQTHEAAAERLPFDDATFDLVATRFSAHHWRTLEPGIAEAHRVAKPGATVIFIDPVAPGRALHDTHLQAVELLRDTSHVRDYTVAEWTAAVERAGFIVQRVRRHRIRIDFDDWIARMRTPEPLVAAIHALQAAASDEVRAYFAVEPDGSFLLDIMTLETTA